MTVNDNFTCLDCLYIKEIFNDNKSYLFCCKLDKDISVDEDNICEEFESREY